MTDVQPTDPNVPTPEQITPDEKHRRAQQQPNETNEAYRVRRERETREAPEEAETDQT